jgi:hypothetical protein
MSNIRFRAPHVKPPRATYYFFDKIQVWMKQPADTTTLARLRKLCGSMLDPLNLPAGLHRHRHYRQRLTFMQPQDELLRWLAARKGMRINMVELAIEYVYGHRHDRDNAFEYLHRRLIRRWHSRRQLIRISRTSRHEQLGQPTHGKLPGTRYDGGRRAANRTAFYRAAYSRVTGELDALHLEWRCKGLRAVRAAGISSAADLLRFDHQRFWQRHLLLVDIDPERLGRLIRNRADGTCDRATLDSDGTIGRRWLNMKPTIQEIIDALRPRVRISRALVPLPTTNWV